MPMRFEICRNQNRSNGVAVLCPDCEFMLAKKRQYDYQGLEVLTENLLAQHMNTAPWFPDHPEHPLKRYVCPQCGSKHLVIMSVVVYTEGWVDKHGYWRSLDDKVLTLPNDIDPEGKLPLDE